MRIAIISVAAIVSPGARGVNTFVVVLYLPTKRLTSAESVSGSPGAATAATAKRLNTSASAIKMPRSFFAFFI